MSKKLLHHEERDSPRAGEKYFPVFPAVGWISSSACAKPLGSDEAFFSRKQCALVKDDTVIIIKRKLGEAEAMRSMCQAWRSREDLEGCCIGSLAGTWGEH